MRAGVIPDSRGIAQNGDDCRPVIAAMLPIYFADPGDPRIASFQSACSSETLERTMAALGDFDYRPQLATLAVPVLVIMGDRDPFGLDWARAAKAALPPERSELLEIAGSGHFPWIDEGAEGFYAAVRAQLTGATRGSAR